jgi:hypothetical protein
MTRAQDAQQAIVPLREDWPDLPPPAEAGAVLTDLILTTFRLNGRLVDIAQEIAGKGGIIAAWWQELGGVLDRPRSVAEIWRLMGMTRQGVQRVADLLVARHFAEYPRIQHTSEPSYWPALKPAIARCAASAVSSGRSSTGSELRWARTSCGLH